jgi:cell division protein FtsL
MLKPLHFKALCTLAAIAVILVGINIYMYTTNVKLQANVNDRAQYIQQSIQISELYQNIARNLADLAVRNNDEQLRQMLTQEGFVINAPSAPPAKAAPKGKP